MYQPQHLPFFKIFFCILCTNRSPSPVDFSFTETSADPHHITDTPHQATLAPPHIRKYVPTFPRSHAPLCLTVLPTVQPYHCTTAPPHRTQASQSYHRTTVPPYHRTFPRPCKHTTALHSQAHDLLTTQPHDPDPRRPVRRRRRRIDAGSTPSRRSIDAAPDATGARVAAGPPSTLATALTRRVDVRTPSRRRPDTVTPFTVPACWQGCSPA